jgi:YbbR domain-containing protein
MLQVVRRFCTRNVGLKLLSLAIAMLLWWTVAREPEAQMVMRVPVEFYHMPKDLQFSTETVPQAQIRVRGPVHVLHDLAQADVHPVIDLSNATAGEQTYPIRPNSIRVPRGAEIEQIIPAQLRLSFDVPLQRTVPVRARITGSLVSGYRIAAVVVEPQTVQIEGPSRRVQLIESALTDPVDATGVIGSASFSTSVYTTDPLVKVNTAQSVRVTVVTEKIQTKAGSD